MSWFGGVVGWLIGSSSSESIKPELPELKPRKEDSTQSKTIVVGSSNLNPNAKVFTPPLNPNAKEFTPAKRDQQQQQQQQTVSETSPTRSFNSTTLLVTAASPDSNQPASESTACDEIVVAAEKQDFEEPSQKKNFEKSSQNDLTEESAAKDVFQEPSHNLTPSNSSICVTNTPDTPICVTPEMEGPLKSTNQRLCTPWVQNGEVKTSRNLDDTDEDMLECDDFNFSLGEDDSDEDEDDENDDLEEFVLQGNAQKSSVCDDDGNW